MKKVKKDDDQIKWSKKDIWLLIFVFVTMSSPVLIADFFGNLGSWILDFLLIVASVVKAKNVFKDHYDNVLQYSIMCLVMVSFMIIYNVIIITYLNKTTVSEAMNIGLNYTIRMLSIFMLSYSFYYDNIKKGKICDNLKKLKSKMK